MGNIANRVLLADYLGGQVSGAVMGRNYIKNPSGLFNVNNISVANSATVSRNTSTPLTRVADIQVTLPNNTNGYAEWSANTMDLSLGGQNCELRFDYIASSIGSQVFAQVLDTGTVVAQQQLSAASSPRQFSLNVPCNGTGATTTVRLTNATGNSGTSNIKVANMSYGRATNLSNVSQASLYGTLNFVGVSNCTWTNNDGSNFAAFSADSDCNTPTATGNANASAGKIPAVNFSQLAPGDYQVIFNGRMTGGSTDRCFFEIYDGATSSGTTDGGNSTNPTLMSGVFSYTTPQSNKTFQIRAKRISGSTGCEIGAGGSDRPVQFQIYRFPSSSELAIRTDQADYGWTAYTPTFEGLGTVSGVKVYHRKVGENLEVNGYFKPGTPSAVPATISLPAGLLVDGTKISNTTSTAWVGWANQMTTSGTPANFTATNRFHIFYDGSTGGKLFLAVQSGTSEFTKNNGTALYNSGEGASFFFSVPIQGWRVTSGAPLLVGSVTSNSSGLERIERAVIGTTNATTGCSSSPCTVFNSSSTWISATRSGTGSYTYTLSGFTSTPVCTCTVNRAASVFVSCSVTSATSVTALSANASTVNQDEPVSIICMGPR